MEQNEYIRAIKKAAIPILYGPDAAEYGLSILQVDAIRAAAEDAHSLQQLFFNAGFAAGRQYERDHNGQQERRAEQF